MERTVDVHVKREGNLLDREDSLGATKSVGQERGTPTRVLSLFCIYGEKTPRVNLCDSAQSCVAVVCCSSSVLQ